MVAVGREGWKNTLRCLQKAKSVVYIHIRAPPGIRRFKGPDTTYGFGSGNDSGLRCPRIEFNSRSGRVGVFTDFSPWPKISTDRWSAEPQKPPVGLEAPSGGGGMLCIYTSERLLEFDPFGAQTQKSDRKGIPVGSM